MCRIERTGSLVLLFAHAAGRMPTLPVSSAYINPHGRPRRIDNRNFIASNNHEQPFRVGCSKQTSKTYTFFAYGFTSFDNQIRGKVDISPFFDMAMPTCFQSFFEIEINSSDFISKM